MQWKGVLVVPAHGPSVTEYGVWVTQDGGGLGVSPEPSGVFGAVGSSRALSIEVRYPSLGVRLMDQELIITPTEEGGIGQIDLRGVVWVFDAIITDEKDQPHTDMGMHLQAQGMSAISPDGFMTDSEGRLHLVLPERVKQFVLTRRDGGSVTLHRNRIPARVALH